jgi:hypothetical protein
MSSPHKPDMASPDDSENQAHREYTHRLSTIKGLLAGYERQHITIGNLRLAVFVSAVVLTWLAFIRDNVSGWWLLVPVVVFVGLMRFHDHLLTRRARAERRAHFYERGLERIEERWQGTGSTGQRFLSPEHPYAGDLDLFGPGSLFQLLSMARTGPGERRLADWLLAPAPVPIISARQQAVTELADKLDLRENLAVVGDAAITDKESAPLWEWSSKPPLRITKPLRITAAVLALGMAIALLWFFYADFLYLGGAATRPPLNPLRFLIAMIFFNGGFGLLWRRKVAKAIEEFECIRAGIALLSDLVLAVEQARFECPKLRELQQKLGTRPRPSRHLAALSRIADLLDSRDNLFLRVFGPPLLWTTQVMFALEHWRARYGSLTRAWVETVAEIEALNSLGTYAYEHPADPFPQFVETGRTFTGRELGHPLVPACVRNSITLSPGAPLFVVSGSNMSGKSTLLRTIGTNAVLAFAGAPVRAVSLELSSLTIGASLHVLDSLSEGQSHFSAEIKRIRTIVDLAEGLGPTLFLIDEILQGTNSQDRLTGTRAILERLLAHNAIGLITTHDLALTKLEGMAGLATTNVHFQDEIRDGKMTFDYKLKPGVVQGSNAIELMRLYGLLQ